jgi:hypothetical protein
MWHSSMKLSISESYKGSELAVLYEGSFDASHIELQQESSTAPAKALRRSQH